MTSYRYFLLSSVLQFPYSFNVQQYRFFKYRTIYCIDSELETSPLWRSTVAFTYLKS